jgi:apolipoprotein N-acyltransferase
LLLLAFAVLSLQLDAARQAARPLRTAFGCGWAFAFGQYLIGWHWIGYAFLVDPDAHLWQLPFAVTLLPAALAIYAGLACALSLWVWRLRHFSQDGRLLVFASLYIISEWLRGHLFTGFPWNLQAYGWGASLAVMQSMAAIGAYGLSFLTILLGASLADFTRPASLPAFRAPLAMIALFLLLWAGGAVRLMAHPVENVAGVRLRIVQPDVPQREKDEPRYFARNWRRLLDLSVLPGNPTHIIWPEAAPPPLMFDRDHAALDEVGLLTATGRSLITGATRAQRDGDSLSFYNSLFIFPPGGAKPVVYDKFHLVPFGEYVPFAGILNHIGITKLTAGQEGFSTGDGPHTYGLAGAPAISPLICYEIIFPAAVTSGQRPGWFVNVTDDSWFGPWAGPYQHFLIARARAIEEALPVARAANTGISAVIDPYGRITAELGLGKMGVLDAGLPKAAPQSTYARYGDWTLLLLLLAAAISACVL